MCIGCRTSWKKSTKEESKSTSMRMQTSATRCRRLAAALAARMATRAMPNGLEYDGFASRATSCPAIHTSSSAPRSSAAPAAHE
jgi:hypothetical protein